MRSEITIVRRAGQPVVLKRTVATVLFSTPRRLSLLYQRVRSEITIVRRAGQPVVLKRTVTTVLFSTPRRLSLLYQHVSVRKSIAAVAL